MRLTAEPPPAPPALPASRRWLPRMTPATNSKEENKLLLCQHVKSPFRQKFLLSLSVFPTAWLLSVDGRHENHSSLGEIRCFETEIGDLRLSCRSDEKIFLGVRGMDGTWRYTSCSS